MSLSFSETQISNSRDAFTTNYNGGERNGFGGIPETGYGFRLATDSTAKLVEDKDLRQRLTNLLNDLTQQLSLAENAARNSGGQASQQSAQFGAVQDDTKKLEAEFEYQKSIGLNTRINGWEKFPEGTIKLKISDVTVEGHFEHNRFITTNPINPPYYTKLQKRSFPKEGEIQAKGEFKVINPGATVKLQSLYPIYYCINILGCTVTEILSNKSTNNSKDTLTIVPPEYYRIYFQTFGSDIMTFVEFPIALSARDEGWSDDIVVTYHSAVGPNTIDIVRYLINRYSSLQIDETSFNYVHSKIDPYPSNFVLLDKKNIIQLLEEISFQARLAIWLKDNVYYVRYLPEETTHVDTITEDDIEYGSLEINYSNTEELVTKLKARWKFFYENKESNEIVLRYNINKYGVHEKSYDFYIYNFYNVVQQAASYWIIRKGNTWKKIKFRTFLHKLRLEAFDTVLLNFTNSWVANGPVKGIVESAKYNSINNTIDVEIWVPIRIGEMTQYKFAFPYGLSEFDYFPTVEDYIQGNAGSPTNSNVIGEIPGSTFSSAGPPSAVANTNPNISYSSNHISPNPTAPQDHGTRPEQALLQQSYTSEGGQSVPTINPYQISIREPKLDNKPNETLYKTGQEINIGGNRVQILSVDVFDNNDGTKRVEYQISEPLGPTLGPDSPLDGGAITPKFSTPIIGNNQRPYNYRNYGKPKVETVPNFIRPKLAPPGGASATTVYLGQVISGTGNTYTVEIYGTNGESAGQVTATVPQIESSEQIPAGTWIAAVHKFDGDVYKFQIPVWL